MHASTFHVTCGDCAADRLRQSGLPGTVHVMHDPVCCGPMPSTDWYQTRAQWLVACGAPFAVAELAQGLEREDSLLAEQSTTGEVVLWFDHCLFDQSILVRTLDRLTNCAANLSLVCIGDFPGFTRFKGLGELTPAQMASLWPQRHAVSGAEKTLAGRAWAALRSADPRALRQLLGEDLRALPYLRAALYRRLEELPSAHNGLSRTEHAALAALAGGPRSLPELFGRVSDAEEAPFLGDTMFYWVLEQLRRAERPAVAVAGPGPLPLWETSTDLDAWIVSLTPTGRALLAGTADWVRLSGDAVCWRWNAESQNLEER